MTGIESNHDLVSESSSEDPETKANDDKDFACEQLAEYIIAVYLNNDPIHVVRSYQLSHWVVLGGMTGFVERMAMPLGCQNIKVFYANETHPQV